ncbi:MAG: hypothetical protein IBJ11_11950 [Phycisphaerales bacterium]|nr:hypothetical protein [Phycisphaerales bacterium]
MFRKCFVRVLALAFIVTCYGGAKIALAADLQISPGVPGQPQGDAVNGWTIDLNPSNTIDGQSYTIQLRSWQPGVRYAIRWIRATSGSEARQISLSVSSNGGTLDLYEMRVLGSTPNFRVELGNVQLGDQGSLVPTPRSACGRVFSRSPSPARNWT